MKMPISHIWKPRECPFSICGISMTPREPLAETRAAMESGVEAIAQATLASGRWFGRSDVLRRVERASKLGGWSYEVYDCKLACETKAATILQLSLYSELLESIQGVLPESMFVVPPGVDFQPEKYRVLDFAAYYRFVKARLERAVEQNRNGITTFAEPTAHCEICRWWQECDADWRKQDHLSLVAGINRLQRKQLSAWEVTTVERLAVLPLPIPNRPDHGSKRGIRQGPRTSCGCRWPAASVASLFMKYSKSLMNMVSRCCRSLLPETFSSTLKVIHLWAWVDENTSSASPG